MEHKHKEQQALSLCPNVLLLLHSLFNEYSERQINTDATMAKRWKKRCGKSKGTGEQEQVDPSELLIRS